MSEQRPTLVLVDGYNLVFRAFYAIAPLSAPDGTPSNAVLGFCRMLLGLLRDLDPSHLAVVMDAGGKNFRHQIYEQYKANRPEAPDELKAQFPLVREAVEALGLPLVEQPGVEADDVIGTLAEQAAGQGFEVIIVSGDKDLMQLVNERICMLDTMKNVRYDPAAVEKKLGVPPEKVIDLLALQGDSSDNIPGVTKVGPKTAVKLLGEHGDLEGVLAAAPAMKKSKLRQRLIEEAEQARLSQRLATIERAVPLPVTLDELRRRPAERRRLDEFLARLGFSQLRRQLTARQTVDRSRYAIVRELEELDRWLQRARDSGLLALDLETTSLDPLRAEVVGLSLCPQQGQAAYLPLGHRGDDAGRQLEARPVFERLAALIDSGAVGIYGQNIKYDAVILAHRQGLELPVPAGDAMVASYVLDPGRSSHGLDALALEFLGHRTITYEEVAGKGREQVRFDEVPVERAAEYAAEDADVTFRLCRLLGEKVKEEGLDEVLRRIELPLVPVLVDMELRGVLLEVEPLQELSREITGRIERQRARIIELAGEEFNVNSPAQLRVVLFEKLGFPVIKKTRSGPSTDSSVLEELAGEHEIAAAILEYRSLSKLKSTYLDVLPRMVNPETGRIHTRYNQTVTATGRLSSSDPNLQNIPIRGELGPRLRRAFVAPPGWSLLSADYSQVELRILAHLSGDADLIAAFQRGDDIHAATAARIFGLPVDAVDRESRARAKAVNFGIVYGQGPYNLARQLRITRRQAKEIIDSYFQRYPAVKDWVDGIHRQARAEKQVKTLFGRRRRLPEISSSDHNRRANAERMAQNTPIQGTAADIIKLAMVEIFTDLRRRGLSSRMVMQVHDELVFEVAPGELELLQRLVREKMESVVQLRVPLTVDLASGANWAEAHA